MIHEDLVIGKEYLVYDKLKLSVNRLKFHSKGAANAMFEGDTPTRKNYRMWVLLNDVPDQVSEIE